MVSRWRQESAAGASNFRRGLDTELTELFDESRAAQIEQARGVRDRAVGALERLLDESTLYRQKVRPQVDSGLRQGGQSIGHGWLRCARRHTGDRAGLQQVE